MGLLDELVQKITDMPEKVQKELINDAMESTKHLVWVPTPGPQSDAYFCEADELFYGGQAGGGKSALGVGLALTAHTDSLILRRQSKEAAKFFEVIESYLGHTTGRNMGAASKWDLGDRQIDIGGCQHESDKQKFKGIPHDLIFFDELPDFTRSQYEFIKTWNRTTRKGQRCRVVAAGNPPTTSEGLWVIEYWAAWLDPRYPNPAQSGEIRHFIVDRFGNSVEVPEKGRFMINHATKEVTRVADDCVEKGNGDIEYLASSSRCFIRARLEDNPFLGEEYAAKLDSMPEELRQAYRDGRFDLSLKDNPQQIIPTSWVMAAVRRWTPHPPENVPMCAIGVDIAQGGKDETVLAPRYDGWYAPLVAVPGEKTPDGRSVFTLIMNTRRDSALPIIDMGGGFGGATKQILEDNEIKYSAYKGALATNSRSKCRTYGFRNKRAQTYWQFREALDPEQPGGSPIMLPDDPKMIADLTAGTYTIEKGKNGLEVVMEEKAVICARMGRSTDRGDAVVEAYTDGAKSDVYATMWMNKGRNAAPTVNMGRASQRRQR